MESYRAVMRNTREPHLVGFGVTGKPDDYRFFRYAFASCLMDDGYFPFDDRAQGGSSVAWFDEYDVSLGAPVSLPVTRPWQGNVFRRDFEHGIVLLNPGNTAVSVVLETGFIRVAGKQDPRVNTSEPVVEGVILPPRDGFVLRHGQREHRTVW